MSTMVGNFMTTQEAAAEIGVTDSLVRKWIREERLAAERAGAKTWLITRKEVDRFKKIPRPSGRPAQE